MSSIGKKILLPFLLVSLLVVSPVGFFYNTQQIFSSGSVFPIAYAGDGGSVGGGEGGPNTLGDATPNQSQVDAANAVNASLNSDAVNATQSYFGGFQGPDTSFNFGFGIMDALAFVASLVLGPVAGLAVTAVGIVANALGVPNPGVAGTVSTNGEVSVSSKGDVGVGGALGAVMGALGISPAGVLGGITGAPVGATLSGGTDSPVGPSGDSPPAGGGADGGQGPAVLSQQVVVNSQTESLAGLSCPADSPQLCGTSASNASCIPATAVCCTSVGYADRYCPANNFCTTDGRCESSTGGRNCAASYNSACQSPANSCGMTNSGFASCNGSCQAVTPADSSCPTPGITLTQAPAYVNIGDICSVTWTTTNTTACNLVNMNTGATAASGKNGTYVTPPMTAQVDFRLNCQNGIVVSNHADVSCRINPAFIEN